MTCNGRIFPTKAKLILCKDPENPDILCSAEEPVSLCSSRAHLSHPQAEENPSRLSKNAVAGPGLPPHTWCQGGGDRPHQPQKECAWGGQVPHHSNPGLCVLIPAVPGSKLRS